MSVTGNIKIFSGNAHRELAEEICRHLNCDLGQASTERFSDGEFNFQIGENDSWRSNVSTDEERVSSRVLFLFSTLKCRPKS